MFFYRHYLKNLYPLNCAKEWKKVLLEVTERLVKSYKFLTVVYIVFMPGSIYQIIGTILYNMKWH